VAFSPAVRAWFEASFPEPTAPQAKGWPAIARGDHTLILAPTGTGKTLAAFLWGIDRLTSTPQPAEPGTRILYISPLRALAFDVEKNLRAPVKGIQLAAERLGVPFVEPTVGIRTGDSSSKERSRLVRHPPDLLITTPESLYLMLTSNARESLRNVEVVIIDEIHALAPTKRGAHLSLSMERLDAWCAKPPQRIGLSATQRPLEEVARFLGGSCDDKPRPVTIVDAGVRKPMELDVVVPIEDMTDLGRPQQGDDGRPVSAVAAPAGRSIWPEIYPRILDQILAHRSTIIFCNARRQAERLAARLNELAIDRGLVGTEDLVKAHHGSLAREQRVVIEDQLKNGELRGLVATSSLELGIDMGAVDLVIQVESPGAVSRGLQRVGRAGHSVGEPSKGTIYPKHRGDLLEATVVAHRMREGAIEATRYLRNPLDVLAQQVVAHVAMGDAAVDDVRSMVRRSACFADITDDVFDGVIDLLAGRYPSEEFNELRPRLVWDRVGGVLRARDGSKRLAVTSGGTIPDRGLFGVFLPDGSRVGELDEEMVYESRPGETFVLGASTWRIEDITFQKVVVTPAPGQPGKMPFWHGDRPGRPLELGRALGAFVRDMRGRTAGTGAAHLVEHYGLDANAANNVVLYLDDQAEATGVVPDDRTIVVERFRDEIGDWRICLHSPFGTPVHAPWAMAIERMLVDRYDIAVETMWGDDGIVVRLPESADELPLESILVDPADIDELVVSTLPSTSMFASRFRECAARALLLPRRRPDQRTPLWQQRQRAADLLAVAARYPSFPILLETSRECLQDVFDVPALREVLSDVRSRKIRVVSVDTPKASPFAQSLLFNWIATYMYEGDAPLAERRAAALALDRDLLRELLGAEELRDLIDADVLTDLELELQRLVDNRRARTIDEMHDTLRVLGDLAIDELDMRSHEPVAAWVATLVAEKRAVEIRMPSDGSVRYIAAEDAARYRDALGAALPVGLPRAFTDPVDRPLESLIARYARTHGPFVTNSVARRFGITDETAVLVLQALERAGRIVRGEFRPEGREREWCDNDVLRQLRRRSLASLRKEVESVEPAAFARFLAAWHGVGTPRRGVDALVEALGLLQGAALPVGALESAVLPARVAGYRPADLDALCTAGELVWVGAGKDKVRLYFRDQAALLADPPPVVSDVVSDAVSDASPNAVMDGDGPPSEPLHDALRSLLAATGACFWPQLRAAAPSATDAEVLTALWDLVWAGAVTNDSLGALRAVARGDKPSTANRASRGRPRVGRLTRLGPPQAAGRWSLVAPSLLPTPSPTERAHARATQLLERHGVVTREAVTAEGVDGGFTSVYGVLKMLEERGVARRGYFISGLGAAQFALPGAVDRLRATREPTDDATPVVLAASDPAQPYGAALPWPESAGRPARVATALVVSLNGEACVWFDPSSRHLVLFEGHDVHTAWIDALIGLVKDGRFGSIEVRKIDGEPIGAQSVADGLRRAGFQDGYKGLVFRA
jgi:ATP-dependent helicase Lhr and Lhr-like helicase